MCSTCGPPQISLEKFDRIDFDAVAIFGVKDAHRPLLFGFGHGHFRKRHRPVVFNGVVNHILRLLDLFPASVYPDEKNQTQSLGRDVAALLDDLVTQDFPERGQKKMRRGVELSRLFRRVGQATLEFPGRRRPGEVLMLFEFGFEARAINADSLLLRQFFGHLNRKAVALVQAKSVFAADFLAGEFIKFLQPLN